MVGLLVERLRGGWGSTGFARTVDEWLVQTPLVLSLSRDRWRIDLVRGMGGFVSVPLVLSLSKDWWRIDQGFDRLSPNGR